MDWPAYFIDVFHNLKFIKNIEETITDIVAVHKLGYVKLFNIGHNKTDDHLPTPFTVRNL